MTTRIVLASLAGFIGMGGISFACFAAWFNGKEIGNLFVLYSVFTIATGVIVGTITPHKWYLALAAALIPIGGLAFLLLLGAMEAASLRNLPSIVSCLFFAIILTVSAFCAGRIFRNKHSDRSPPKT
jgi:hypothetical protein